MEFQGNRKNGGNGNNRYLADTGQIHHAVEIGSCITYHQTKKNGKLLIERMGLHVKNQAGNQGNGTYNEVFRIAKIRSAKAAAKGIGADGKKGEPDSRHYGSRHNRRHKFLPPGGPKAKNPFQHTADKGCPQYGAIAVLCTNDAGHRYEGKADTHNDGKAAPKPPATIMADCTRAPDSSGDIFTAPATIRIGAMLATNMASTC
jgi:hypothetical protein